MIRVLIFGGTSEGRIIAEILSENKIDVHVSVATNYGRQTLKENENLKIFEGRLNADAMIKLCDKNKYDFVIDATHPFATEVSQNIKKCISEIKLPLVRFERNVDVFRTKEIVYVKDALECKNLLLQTKGKILLTTGSKDLNIFCSEETLRNRIVARVLPGIESLNLCYENKLDGRQIIAMQGPFSKNMNTIQIEDYGISVLVTKESGKTGGTDQKILAAMEKGIKCIVIKNPNFPEVSIGTALDYHHFDTLQKLFDYIEENYSIEIINSNRINVSLIGIGMGSEKNMTIEAVEKISEADLVFGAARMISSLEIKAKKYPFYLSEKIIPIIKNYTKDNNENINISILFSGDSGFYSGAAKLKVELEKLENINISILPGISSMSYLSSKVGISYQDAEIISLHGIEKSVWFTKLSKALAENKKIFLLTSGLNDMQEVGKIISDYNNKSGVNYKIAIGYQLSYENERTELLEPEQLLSLKEEGLYSLFAFLD